MSARLPPTVESVVIDSGNLLSLEDLKRKVSIHPNEEFAEGITRIVTQWQPNGDLKPDTKTAFLANGHNPSSATVLSAERQTYRITVKLFLFDDCGHDCPSLRSGVDVVLKQLGIESIDSLIVSLPSRTTKLSLDDIKPFWTCAETFVTDGRASQLGVSDLDTNQLAALYEWAHTSKPTTNHINLEACCVIPEEMSAYAKQHNIQLLTHNDPKDFLPESRFNEIMSHLVDPNESKLWKRVWIARYSIIVAGKGILQNKGYILSAKKCAQN
ncbi:unnamed protein product [Medioppia subpectinata]|uniref:GCS light chain n=1 Tax=Medioppia subpectinata TaxID=1979941 RepID=A0A7R9PV96_9ACAR|nr:unnamed protein product [Medioppia subpectinata]CAG2102379.1 unnamed protein product [Medioppia subpectinata]